MAFSAVTMTGMASCGMLLYGVSSHALGVDDDKPQVVRRVLHQQTGDNRV